MSASEAETTRILVGRWRNHAIQTRSYSFWARVELFVQVLMNAGGTGLVLFFTVFEDDDVAEGLLFLIPHAAMIAWIVFGYASAAKRPKEGMRYAAAPTSVQGAVEVARVRLAQALEIPSPEITVLVARRRLDSGASLAGSASRPVVIISIGFLTMLRRRPGEAQAILAHEVSHAFQRDLALWKLASIWTWRVLPAAMLSFVAAVVLCVLQWEVIVPAFMPSMLYYILYNSVRIGRRHSEYQADLGAAIVCGLGPTLAALRGSHTEKEEQGVLSMHPPTHDRIRNVQGYAQEVGIPLS